MSPRDGAAGRADELLGDVVSPRLSDPRSGAGSRRGVSPCWCDRGACACSRAIPTSTPSCATKSGGRDGARAAWRAWRAGCARSISTAWCRRTARGGRRSSSPPPASRAASASARAAARSSTTSTYTATGRDTTSSGTSPWRRPSACCPSRLRCTCRCRRRPPSGPRRCSRRVRARSSASRPARCGAPSAGRRRDSRSGRRAGGRRRALCRAGGPDEVALAEEVRARSGGRDAVLAGRTTWRPSAAVVDRLALLVCNDSAPRHVACARGVPVVAIFCAPRSGSATARGVRCAMWSRPTSTAGRARPRRTALPRGTETAGVW